MVWWMEVTPALVGVAVLAATYRRFRLTPLVYALVLLFALILLIGGHYTYSRVPLGNWLRDAFSLTRNHFDRIGHFMQGVTPGMIARELLLRTSPLRRRRWLFFLVVCVALALSAVYELVEWIAAALSETAAQDFVGMQGDEWDAQKDMGLALLGAVLAQLALGRLHDRQLAKMAA